MLSIFGDLDFTELMLDHFYRLLRGFTGFYLVFYELLLTGSRFVFGSIFPFFLFPLDLGSRVAILAGIPYNMIHFRADVIRIIISIRTKRATKWQRVDRDLFVCLFVCLFVKKKINGFAPGLPFGQRRRRFGQFEQFGGRAPRLADVQQGKPLLDRRR